MGAHGANRCRRRAQRQFLLNVLELLQSGGWLMLPIALASVVALAVCVERAWALRSAAVAPAHLGSELLQAAGADGWERVRPRYERIPLGRVLLAGGAVAAFGRERMKEAMEEAAAGVVHELERHLTALGVIASATPLLGLLGTVIGMIRVFAVLVEEGQANPALLAGGISEALVTTAAGIAVAIPALVFHRVLQRKVDALVVTMEREAGQLADAMQPDVRPAERVRPTERVPE